MSSGLKRGLEYLAKHLVSSFSEDSLSQVGPCDLDVRSFHEVEWKNAATKLTRQNLAMAFLPRTGLVSSAIGRDAASFLLLQA